MAKSRKSKMKPEIYFQHLEASVLSTLETMRVSGKNSAKTKQRHGEAVAAIRKFTKHVTSGKAAKAPVILKLKKSKKRKKAKPETSAEVAPLALADAKPSNVLSAPRGGTADDLKLVAGIGPKLEGVLNDLGIYHFDQIAAWSDAEIAWVDDYLQFSGRIVRDDWIAQAAALAKGGREEYVKVFGKEPR